jgi:hypothetical protein
MISLTIAEKPLQVAEGRTLLEACREHGIVIPTLCYHPALEPYGGCRLLHGGTGYATAAASPVGVLRIPLRRRPWCAHQQRTGPKEPPDDCRTLTGRCLRTCRNCWNWPTSWCANGSLLSLPEENTLRPVAAYACVPAGRSWAWQPSA